MNPEQFTSTLSSARPVRARPARVGPRILEPPNVQLPAGESHTQGLRVLYLNVNNDPRCELAGWEAYSWERRWPTLVRLVLDRRPDVFALTEITGANLLAHLAPALAEEYGLRYWERAPGDLEFCHAVFYKRTSVFVLTAVSVWMSTTPQVPSSNLFQDHQRGRNILHLTVLPVITTPRGQRQVVWAGQDTFSHPLHLLVTHFGLPELAKDQQAAFLRNVYSNIPPVAPVLLLGDLNSFAGPDSHADIQRGTLVAAGLEDLRARTVLESTGEQALATFEPYPVEGEETCARIRALGPAFLDAAMARSMPSAPIGPVPRDPRTSTLRIHRVAVLDTASTPDGVPVSDHRPMQLDAAWTV